MACMHGENEPPFKEWVAASSWNSACFCFAIIALFLLLNSATVGAQSSDQHTIDTPPTDIFDHAIGTPVSTQAITFLHEDYPPYVYIKDGKVIGKIAELTEALLSQIGAKAIWRQTNYSRLIRELQFGETPVCASGYSGLHVDSFQLIASKPIAWFPGAALVIRSEDYPLFSNHHSIQDILEDKTLRGAFLRDVDYQGITSALSGQDTSRHILIGGSDTELGLLVARGRVHYAPINPDQTRYLRRMELAARNVRVLRPAGMRPPREVGVICSNSIDPDFFNRLNAVIEPLGEYVPE